MKAKIKTKHVVIIVILLLLLLLVIFSLTLKEDRKLNKVESFVKDTSSVVIKVCSAPFRVIIDNVKQFIDLKDIYEKYQEILPYVQRIDSLTVENIELREQIKALKEQLNITYTINDYEFLNATVISRNIAYWYNTITIDKGTFNGIATDMIVVNSQGLVGKVISTTTFTSEVKLLTTNTMNNKISVAVYNGNNKLYGLINKYNYDNNYLEIEGISNTEKVSVGNYVYTSGLGGVFPSGILVGEVSDITTDEYDLAKIIQVTPAVDFNNIDYVAVLKRKESNK